MLLKNTQTPMHDNHDFGVSIEPIYRLIFRDVDDIEKTDTDSPIWST